MQKEPKKIESKSDSRETKSGLILHQYKGAGGLAEIYQSMAVKLCLLQRDDKKTFTEITPYVQCYDFLCDSYSSSIEKVDFSTYGFSWKGSKKSPDSTGIYLGIKFPDKASKANFETNIRFLHDIEKKNNIPLTELHTLGTHSAISIGSTKWLANCLTLRLYLFLFRAFSYEIKSDDWIKELGSKNYSDSNYIKNLARKSWDRILGDLTSIHTDYFCGLSFKKHGTGAVHHNSGYFSTFSNHSEMSTSTVRSGKHWQEMKKRGFELYTK